MAMYNGFVYLAKSDTGHYKIGRSKNPYGRIRHFDTIMPVKVEIIHYFPCDDPVKAEASYHRYASLSPSFGRRVAGEWFELSEHAVAEICNTTHYLNGHAYTNRDRADDGWFEQDCCYETLERSLASEQQPVSSPDGTMYVCVPCLDEVELDRALVVKSANEARYYPERKS